MNEIIAQLRTILPGVWSYRWSALLTSIFLGIILAFFVATIPNKYEASARVHVDTQTILQPLMRGLTVQPDLADQIRMMARTLLSRPNVERVVKQADLDLKFTDPLKQDKFIKQLQKTIEFNSAGRNNLYTITYRSETSEDALNVVRSLLDVFVEESIGDKRRDGDQARRFIDEQITAYEQRLIDAENALKEFKLQNFGRMPDSTRDYASRSSQAQQELDSAMSELRQAASARDALRREAALESPALANSELNIFETSEPPRTDTDARLQTARAQLDTLLIRYTESHPDVENLNFVINELEKRKRAELREFQARRVDGAPQAGALTQVGSRAYNAIRASEAEAEARVASLQTRVNGLRQKFRAIRTNAQSSTEVEMALAQLNRDYAINKKSYEQLLSRRESAEITGSLSRTTNLAEFRIVDPPRAEPDAVSPNRQLFMLIALAISVAVGIALAVLRTFLRPVFYDPDSIREITGHQTLGVITTVSSTRARLARTISHVGFSSLMLIYVGLFMAFTWYVSRHGIPAGLDNFQLPERLNQLTGLL